jgi:hypothetical protein
MGVLPKTNTLIYDILQSALAKHGEYQGSVYVNPLVLILQNIPDGDVKHLQAGVIRAAPFYRFYSVRPGMTEIPLEMHVYPDGGATQVLAELLTKRARQYGLDKLHSTCQTERKQKHNYVRNFACDGRDKVESLVRRRR